MRTGISGCLLRNVSAALTPAGPLPMAMNPGAATFPGYHFAGCVTCLVRLLSYLLIVDSPHETQAFRSCSRGFRYRDNANSPSLATAVLRGRDTRRRLVDPVHAQLTRVDRLLKRSQDGGHLVGGDPQRDVGTCLQRLQHRLGDAVTFVDRGHAGQVVGVHQPGEGWAAVTA